jgi:hypothetical protein
MYEDGTPCTQNQFFGSKGDGWGYQCVFRLLFPPGLWAIKGLGENASNASRWTGYIVFRLEVQSTIDGYIRREGPSVTAMAGIQNLTSGEYYVAVITGQHGTPHHAQSEFQILWIKD